MKIGSKSRRKTRARVVGLAFWALCAKTAKIGYLARKRKVVRSGETPRQKARLQEKAQQG